MIRRCLFFLIACLLFQFSFAQTYQSVESTEYDEANNRWLVSNGNSIIARASNGDLSFFGNGSASFGMEVMGNTLFAIGNNDIKGYDLTTEQEVMSISISGAQFLNGLTNDGNSKLYATDFGAGSIYEIDVSDFNNPVATRIVSSTGSTPNGIIYDGDNNRLIFVSWGSNATIFAVDLSDFSVSKIRGTSFGNIDGIDDDNLGNYYISTWSPPRIHQFNNDFQGQPITITTPAISSPADIGYAKATDTLAIPSGGNNVVFVGFEPPVSNQNIDRNLIPLSVFPNPISEQSLIEFSLAATEQVNLAIYDAKGQLVKQLLEGEQPAGPHRVLLTGLSLASGIYHCQLNTASGLSGQLKLLVVD